MEAAPLTLAHTHARNAVLETRKSNPVAASEEHDLAAGEFAAASQKCTDHEALRTLQLLESHHKKLAEILRFQHEHPEASTAALSPTSASAFDTPTARGSAAVQEAHGQPPRLPGHPRIPSRESSSIASNLATARGIPAQPRRGSPVSPALSVQQAGAKMSDNKTRTGESKLREVPRSNRTRARQPWTPPLPSPSEVTSQEVAPPQMTTNARASVADEPFQRFYSTFEGLVSKITAPLAFAGLPLGTDDGAKSGPAAAKSAAETKVDRNHATSDRTSAEPDVNKIFSKAALRSLRDSQGAGPANPAESFCIVSTTGGTMSYAEILKRAEKEARRGSFDEDDDFVDARETPSQSPEIRQSASNIRARAWRGTGDKQMSLRLEELETENKMLKQASDTLSKRLHMWEVNAQSSSMALHQSIRVIQHQRPGSPEQNFRGLSVNNTSPVTTMNPPPSHPPEVDLRIKELEEQVRLSKEKLNLAGAENEKLKKTLGRYQDRWHQLKEGAKTRRAEGRFSDGQSGASSKTPELPTTPQPDTDSSDKSTHRAGKVPEN
ncbi:hypothetical protein N7468_008058 [Penicillium chermesinum]|uniref:Uncharacterized protein n=1 Tax=Penicillium chermesinum TaxID=63820 RepID=A0A9W9NP21_9EURO|nr:uncharacterized protein N7468_008058 [Penicillium chermesinum]KAJ5223516.1 hypothetical protein N7468_008058 [Penicillium chermesinum]KAJ6155654.1 hypothetical protein N7470_006220 [Penicillium chermesinum]